MNELLGTDEFSIWFESLKDSRLRNNVLARLRRASLNDFGDCASIGNGASEMRIHYGAGYRIYFFRNGESLYILLGGGEKRGQRGDISRALALMKQIKEASR